MTKQFLQLEHATLSFSKSGTGNQTLLAFHGFGQSSEVFDGLAAALSATYTLYSVDLFFHGSSEWNLAGEQPLEKAFWKELMTKFLKEQSISTFSVLGFSMGGKFALATLEAFPEKTKEIFLLAPDGINTSMWYSLATYPVALRNLFKSMIQKPKRFFSIANFALKLKLIDKGILRFAESQMDTEEKRNRVYYSWVIFRHLSFNLTAIAQLINEKKINFVLIIGKYDKIITERNMRSFLKKIKSYQLEIPETGHNGVIAASVKILKINSTFTKMESTMRNLFLIICLTVLSIATCSSQDVSEFKKETFTSSAGHVLPYRILFPENYDKTKKYPVVLFLHGSGERGNDNEKQLVHGSKLFLDPANRKAHPAIVIFPQCPEEGYWSSVDVNRSTTPLTLEFDYTKPITPALQATIELLQKTIKQEGADKSRVYIAGLSMGGMGTFEAVYRYPELFAAAVPICGGADVKTYDKRVSKIPFRVFHGAKDVVVDVKHSKTIVEKLKILDTSVEYIEYPEVNHNSWDNAFAEPDFLQWMFSKTRNKK